MAGTDFGIVNEFYNRFSTVVESGYGRILSDVNYVLNFFIIISILLTALFVWTSTEDSVVFRAIVGRIFAIGIFVYATEQWSYLVSVIMRSFFKLGGEAAGVTGDASTVANIPGLFIEQGFNKVLDLANVTNKYSGLVAVFSHFISLVIYSFAILIIFGALMWMALEIFMAIIEYKIITLAGFILLPLNVYQGTSPFGGGIIRYVLGAGVKVMTITMIAQICMQTFSTMTVTQTLNVGNAAALTFGSVISAVLAHRCSNMAQAVVQGTPNVSASHALGTMTSAAAGAAGGAGMAIKGSQAASAVAQRARAAYKAATKVGDDRA